MRTKRILMSILLLLVTFSLVACGKVTVKLSGDTQVKVGQTIKLTPEASKKGATLSWASSNDAVATVKDGSVTGVSAGKVTITVTATSGKKTGEASLEITVVADNAPVISGADDVQILKGVKFVPLQGVTAHDEEDGDLTEQIEYSGNVNYNLVGEYTATYTVRDKSGNVTTVTRKVTVVSNDTDAPLLTGTSAKTIIIGDTQFKLTDNVSANDAIDGDVTASIKVTGEVDVWTLGDYTVKYEVSDAAGNKAEATRVITVGLGEFQFDELVAKEFAKVENDYQFAVELESINTQLSAFALAKLTFKVNAAAACELVPSITNGTAQAKIALAAGNNDVTIYFRVNSAILEGAVKLAAPADANLTFSDVKFAFAEAKDVTAPVINVPEGKMVLPVELLANAAALKPLVLAGVTASDNVDGPVNAGLDVDLSGIAAGTTGEQQVVIFVVDSSNNRGEATRTVEFAKAYSTNVVTDPTFSTDSRYVEGTTDAIWKGFRLHGGAGEPEMYTANGVLVHHNTSDQNPGYDSASCPIIETDSTVLQAESWYMLKFDVKAEVARNMSVRIGLAADSPVWIENFEGASNYMLSVSTEWETKYVVFYVHSDKSVNGYTAIECELKNGGAFTWNSAEEVGNTFYFDNLQFYLLSNENAAPTLTINKDLPTTFGKGQDKPDLTQYVTAYDREDAANITITAAHITETIDMSKAGTYDVVYKVADSEGKEATITLKIKVLEQADTTAPVLAEVADLVKVFDQFATTPDITKFITATDDVDGAIEITMDMIETNADLTKAGSYDIVYTVKDSSGNRSTLTVTITVNDKEAPKVVSKELKTYAGTALTAADIIANLTVTDNVDGAMTLTEANIKGLADVDFAMPGEYKVKVEVTDAAGNKAEVEIAISVREKGATKTVANEVILDLAPLAPEKAEACVVTEAEGVYKVEVSAIGGWASANKMKFTPSVFEQGKQYVLRFTAKADKARPVQFNIGEAMDGTTTGVWMEKYPLAEQGSDLVALTTEYQTFDILFTVQNEKFQWGPTIEFCVGPCGAGSENGNNIYFTELAIYSTKEISNVNLINSTIVPQGHEVTNGLIVAKNGGGQWDWVGLKVEDDLTGYTKMVADVIGADGKPFVLKVNDKLEVTANGNGGVNHVEWTAPADFAWDAAKQTMIIFPDFAVTGAGNEFAIVKLELQGEGKDPIDLLAGKVTLSGDVVSARKMLVLAKPEATTNQWDCAKLQVSDDLTGYEAVQYSVLGTTGDQLLFKVNDSQEAWVTFNGQVQSGIIDIRGMNYSTAKSAMIIFANPGIAGNGNPVYIFELTYLMEFPGSDEPEENPGHVEPTGVAQSSASFASWDEFKTVTFTGLPATNSGSNGWARWDFSSVEDKGYTDVVVKFKATPGLRICAKIDASNTPVNNAYDAIAGNKTTLVAGEDGLVTFTWNLAEFKASAEAANKAFAVENIRKCVVFPSSGLEGEAALTTGSIELVSIDFIKNEPEEVYVPVYPEAIEGTDLITAAVTPNGMQVARQIRMMKTGGGQWDWVGLKTTADLTGYTKMVVEVTGPAGAAFVIKVNDQVEVPANGTGELAHVEWTAPADFAWNAEKQTMIIFPDFNAPGVSNEFTITKFELQGEDKDPIDLLNAQITLSNAFVQACRDLVLTKPTSNTGEWDCVILRLADYAGYDSISYTVKGTEGEKLLFKLNDQQESWLTLDGKVQSGEIAFTGTYDAAKGALVLFPNAGTAGSGNPVVISQLVAVKEPEPEILAPLAVIPTAVNQSASYIEWNEAKSVATLSNLKNSITGSQWGRWDYAGVSDDYADIIVVLKATPGLKVMAKLDALTTPGNNAYDGIAGNKQTFVAGRDGLLVYRWNVAEFEAAAKAAGKEFALENLQKFVFFACDGTGNAEVMASATIELVSINYLQALDVEHAIAKAEELTGKVNGTYSEAMWAVKGTVKSITTYDMKYDSTVVGKNATIELTDGTNTIKAYNVILPGYLDKIYVGETLVVYGYFLYNDTVTMSAKDKNNAVTGAWPVVASLTHKESEIKVSTLSSDNATVKDLSAQKALNCSSFTFKVEAATGHQVVAVSINGAAVEAKDGVYTGIVDGETIITVLTKADGAADPEKVASFTFANTTTGTLTYHLAKEDDNKSADKLTWVQGDITFIDNQDKSSTSCSNNNGAAYVKPYRFYGSHSLEIQYQGMIKVVFNVNSASYASAFMNATFPEGALVTVNDKVVTVEFAKPVDSFKIVNGGSQTRFDSFDVYCLADGNQPQPTDETAPVITISSAVQTALAAKEFWEGANEQATFAAFMQGITATDETDGAITVTQEMINLGGLNPANLVAGDYTITITVKDAAGNEAKQEVKIHVKKYANVNLFADHPGSDGAYNSTKWTREKYENDKWNVITGQMNARTKDGVKVVNMVNGYSVPMRFTYNKDGEVLGVANKLTFKVGNYYTGATAMSVKVKLVLANGSEIFIAGDANNWATIPVTNGLIDQELTFDAAEVKSVVFVTKSANNGSTYLYVGNCVLGYEEPASSPATFQVTNLQAEGDARNHIEGAGAWIWIDPTSIGLTAENMGQFTATATCESINVVGTLFSNYSASAVRCYVTLASAPAADATTTIHLTITNGDASYQGQVSFLGNELQ